MATANRKWTVEETTCLIGIYADNFASLEKLSRKKPIFERMSRRMAEAGYQRSQTQISKKIANLRSEYTKNRPGPTGDETPNWIHYEALHKILHERPALNSTVAETSEIGLQEEERIDFERENDEVTNDDESDPLRESSETPPPKKKQRLLNEAASVCKETLDFMKEQAKLRQEEREECLQTNSQLLGILDRIATSTEKIANKEENVHIVGYE